MDHGVQTRSYGRVFDAIPDDYDRHRPAYPDALIDRACEVGSLAPGSRVLEIGCGTGQLTRGLLARGLKVTAIEPGAQLSSRARRQLVGAGEVEFVGARFEDVSLSPEEPYRAVFSASAIHWIDPDVGWQKIADALKEDGIVALVSYFGLEDPRSAEDQRAIRAALAEIAPDLALEWPAYRDLEATLAGAAQRSHNLSEAWSWLGSYDLARPYVAGLFRDVQLAAVPVGFEHTADELLALLRTMSFWSRCSPSQRDALGAQTALLQEQLGRSIRSSTLACLVTARRTVHS